MIDLGKLNTPQREAAGHGGGPILVLAGAGSGKTRVITFRIAHLLGLGIPPTAICAVTFTNKAAEEMRERVGALVRDKKIARELTIGTFHALGLQILRTERKALGMPRGFTIYDQSDSMGALREAMRAIRDGDRRFDIKAIQTRVSLAKNAFVAPDEYEGNPADEYDAMTTLVYPKYQEMLRACAAFDFDDLIVEPARLFARDEAVGRRWAERFRFVMVDEFQDTNAAQLKMVRHLVTDHQNLCVVGDDDQSIYSWRGADPTNILGFDKLFPGAKVVKLEQNYRSTKTILAAANAVIANNKQRHGKHLWSQLG
ncbi:MAG: UvrD-helicase domain-containing protein [Deltaproteobacteria bacterium]|nr:UvrD-helicase domain-containing protein [Deltaproteobacteria bacterium]